MDNNHSASGERSRGIDNLPDRNPKQVSLSDWAADCHEGTRWRKPSSRARARRYPSRASQIRVTAALTDPFCAAGVHSPGFIGSHHRRHGLGAARKSHCRPHLASRPLP